MRGWGWRAFLPPPPPPPPLRNGGKRNDSLECLFSPMWILFFDSCSIGISVLPPPRGEGSLHPSTSHYTPGNGISSRASNYVEMVYSQSFGPFLSAGEKVLSVCQEGAEGEDARVFNGIWWDAVVKWNCAPLALCKKCFYCAVAPDLSRPPPLLRVAKLRN